VIGTVSRPRRLASTALKSGGRSAPASTASGSWVLETDPSFPSGHVTGTAALLGITAVCVGMGRNRTVTGLGWWAGSSTGGAGHRRHPPLPRCALGSPDVTAGGDPGRRCFVTIGTTVFAALHDRSDQHGVPSVRSHDICEPHPGAEVMRKPHPPRWRLPRRVLATSGGCSPGAGPSGTAPSGSGAGQRHRKRRRQPETNPAGDIPDNQAFVGVHPARRAVPPCRCPKGWARSTERRRDHLHRQS